MQFPDVVFHFLTSRKLVVSFERNRMNVDGVDLLSTMSSEIEK